MIAQLRSDGDSSYHGLTGIYVTMHSILIAAIVLATGFYFDNGTSQIGKLLIPIVVFGLTLFGYHMTNIMYEAQKRYRKKIDIGITA